AVEIDERAVLMYLLGDRLDLLLEESQRVRIGDHEDRGAVVELGAEVTQVDEPLGVAADLHGLEAGEGGARRVGAVGAVGDEDALALGLAAVAEVGGGD